MGRHQKTAPALFQGNGQKFPGVQAQDGPSVRLKVADRGQGMVDPAHGREIRGHQDVVDLADPAVFLVDGTDLGGEHKTDPVQGQPVGLDPGRHQGLDRGRINGAQPKKAGLGLDQMLIQMGQPAGMGEIPGPDHLDPLDRGPGCQAGDLAGLARSPGKTGMDMQIGNVSHTFSGGQIWWLVYRPWVRM